MQRDREAEEGHKHTHNIEIPDGWGLGPGGLSRVAGHPIGKKSTGVGRWRADSAHCTSPPRSHPQRFWCQTGGS